MARRLAVTVGINTYPSAPLQGCINDAVGWRNYLDGRGYYVAQFHDEYATKVNILTALRDRVATLRWGDRLVFTYSGHGTWLPDFDGDELDGRDEAICAFDYEGGGTITDDELAQVFAQRRRGTRVVVISDSCHSGSVSRFTRSPQVVTARYLSPLYFLKGREHEAATRQFVTRRGNTITPRNSAGVVLHSGCDDDEFSYDAYLDGKYQGAFSYAALGLLGEVPNLSMKELHRYVRQALPNPNYPQSPQMYASLWQQRWSL